MRSSVWRWSPSVLIAGVAILASCSRTQGGQGGKMLEAGMAPPELSAVDQNGKTQSLVAERGKPVVVYFYPKDATPGCTKEACAFRDVWKKYEAAGVQVFGVSADDQASHAKFAAEHKLPFPLLADPEKKWINAFGVSTTMGMASRVSFLIGPDGKVAKVYPSVDPGVHAEQVLADAQRTK